MHLSTYKKAIIALIVANIIWGAASPIFKFALQNIPPFTLAFLRFSIGATILFPLVYKEFFNLKNELTNFKKIIFYSLSGVTINIIFFFLALKITQSINAPIIGSSSPIFIMIFSIVLLGEKPQMKKIIGAAVALIGITVIIFEPILKNGLDGSVLGNLFLLIATLGAVGQTIIGRVITKKYNPFSLTFLSFIIGSITFIPFAIPELIHFPALNFHGYIGIIWGAVFSSAIAYSLYAWGLSKIEASEAGLFAYIDPVIAVIIAYPLLGEKPNSLFILGALLVFTGIFIAEKRINYHPIKKLLAKIEI